MVQHMTDEQLDALAGHLKRGHASAAAASGKWDASIGKPRQCPKEYTGMSRLDYFAAYDRTMKDMDEQFEMLTQTDR